MTSERDQLTRDRDALADANKVQQATIEQFTKEKVNLSAKAAYDVGLLVILSKEMRGMPLNDSDKQVMTEIVDKDALTVAARRGHREERRRGRKHHQETCRG